LAAAAFAVVALTGILAGQLSHYWFPWLVIAGGQVPCALAYALVLPQIVASKPVEETVPGGKPPATPGYTLIHPPFGEGSYGKVWLASAASGGWRAIKIVYQASFGENTDPYKREFDGVSRYQGISGRHPGLLRVDYVSEKFPDYFYYVMELGDPVAADWEKEPASYRPRDLFTERTQRHARRLPVRECVRIGLALTDALDFIHQHGLTHRDIKPQNIIFVEGQPKLADLGLIAEIRPPDQVRTYVGTPGYMPPPPEFPGTPRADIYALGMVLYVLCTGKAAAHFPEVATTLVDTQYPTDFLPLNLVILKACQPRPEDRYETAAEMHLALESLPKPKDEGW
jgi:serine/threonine protein kinase